MRFCKCGAVLKPGESCKKCKPVKQTTNERGYRYDHKKASERHRTNYPLCERCLMLVGVIAANPSEQMHHIVSIQESESMRMNPDNWLAVCLPCHDAIEGDSVAGMAVKQWSLDNYEKVLNEGLS